MNINLLDIVNESFSVYAGMTIEDRAIVDARDCLKPAARQCMYAQYLEKITYKKPFKKSHKSVAAAMDHFYVHGDSACYDLLVRMAQPFSMRYLLEDFDGQCGGITDGKPSAARYTEMRLGELGCMLFDGIEKHCINEWFDNYDNTEQFPAVVPSLGFYNICNGTIGIATGLASSIPQYNVREVNEAMIKLLWDRDIDFDEIYCAPDFCTGGTILNATQVKELIKNGCGGSIKMRATAEYDEKERCIYFTEIPYGVHVCKIMEQIKKYVEDGSIVGINKILDLSKKEAKIKIELEKGANAHRLIKKLFKLTSLQDNFTINMVMLEDGRFPKIYGWREALLAHIDHEIKCTRQIYQFNYDKIMARVNIIDGLLIAIADIDNVIAIIKSAVDKGDAANKLVERYKFNEAQVEAILKMPLSRLINMEITSLKDEKEKILAEAAEIQNILNNDKLIRKEIEKRMREVMEKLGDKRRTQLTDMKFDGDAEDAEPIEEKQLIITYTNLGNLYTQESTTLLRARRGTRGTKIKLGNNETVDQVITDNNLTSLLLFTNKGKMYQIPTWDLPLGKINVQNLFEFESDEVPTALTTMSKNDKSYVIFITKNGLIKKTETKFYLTGRAKGTKAIKLKDDDEVVSVFCAKEENVGILTNNGNFVRIDTSEITPIGKLASGVVAIKLSAGDYVVDAKKIGAADKYLITLSKNCLIKKASMQEFPVCNRATKGKRISEAKENDSIVKFLTLGEDCDIIITTEKKNIKISTVELRQLSRAALGVVAIGAENEVARDLKRDVNGS